MAAEIFTGLNVLRILQDTETDADKGITTTIMAAFRYLLECILILGWGTGDSGSATSDPPNDTTGVLTDTGAAYSVDEHNGRTLIMTSGYAKSNAYTIDDTTATTIVCTGDNLYADGVRSGDDYIILYDILNNTSGHNHNGVNSPSATVADGSIGNSKVATGAIDKTKLECGTGGLAASLGAGGAADLTSQDYCFMWSNSASGSGVELHLISSIVSGNYVGRARLQNNAGTSRNYSIYWRYITATDKPFLYAAQDGKGKFIALWFCDDPPPPLWGHDKLPAGFNDWPIRYDSAVWLATNKNTVQFNVPQEQITEIVKKSQTDKLQTIDIFNADYEYDDKKKLFKPKNILTV